MHNLIHDLSTITGFGEYNLEELVNKSVAVISHDIEEALREKESIISVNIGLGELLITNVDDNVMYKFIPSARLEKAIKDTYSERKSLLNVKIDEALGKRIQNTYKDLF